MIRIINNDGKLIREFANLQEAREFAKGTNYAVCYPGSLEPQEQIDAREEKGHNARCHAAVIEFERARAAKAAARGFSYAAEGTVE